MVKSAQQTQFVCLKLLVIAAAGVALYTVLFPFFAKQQERNRQDTCLNNERQIAAAIQMYVQDNQGSLPGDPWTTAALHYLPASKNPDIRAHLLYCPSETAPEAICSYGYNGSLLLLDATGINTIQINQIDSPSEVPLICDANPSHPVGEDIYIPGGGQLPDAANSGVPNARHSKGINVAFCDGHAQYVPTDFTPADCANPVSKGFYECIPLGLVNNPGGGLPLSTACRRKDYRYPSELVIGGEFATMPLLAEMAELWKQHGSVHPKLDYCNTGFQGEYSAKPASLGKDYLWGTVDDAAGTVIAHDALVVIVAKNTKIQPNPVGGLTTISNTSKPSNGWYCCNTATIAAWFSGCVPSLWHPYTYRAEVATARQLARYLALPPGKAHQSGFNVFCRRCRNDREMVFAVANDPLGIGYCSSSCVDYDRVQVLGIQDTVGKQYYFPNRDAKYRTWLPFHYSPYFPPTSVSPKVGPVPDDDWPRALLRTLKVTSAGEGTRLVEDMQSGQLTNGPLFACSYW